MIDRLKSIFLTVFVILIYTGLQAQQRPITSQYMFNHLIINPAYAGNAVQLSVTGLHRDQWVNFPGSPQTQTVSMHSGFRQSNIGVGLVAYHDRIGAHKNTSAFASFSYKIKTAKQGTLSMGVSGGFNNLISDFNLLKLDPNSPDPTFSGVRTKFNPNFGVGFYYSDPKIFLGLSVPYLLNNAVVDAAEAFSAALERRNYYLTGGTTLRLNSDLRIRPSALFIFQEGTPLTFNLNANLVIKEIVSLGVSYRNVDAVYLLFDLVINENFQLGYAYDITTSDIGSYSKGTHEIMINYRVKLGRLHKGVECPTYYAH